MLDSTQDASQKNLGSTQKLFEHFWNIIAHELRLAWNQRLTTDLRCTVSLSALDDDKHKIVKTFLFNTDLLRTLTCFRNNFLFLVFCACANSTLWKNNLKMLWLKLQSVGKWNSTDEIKHPFVRSEQSFRPNIVVFRRYWKHRFPALEEIGIIPSWEENVEFWMKLQPDSMVIKTNIGILS